VLELDGGKIFSILRRKAKHSFQKYMALLLGENIRDIFFQKELKKLKSI
jgi:hypothetical protein